MSDSVDTDSRLRWQLRQLPREIEPARELWPQIEARLVGARVQPAPRRRWVPALAWAAALVLAVGLGWRLQPLPSGAAEAPLLSAAADLDAEYRAALVQFDGRSVPNELRTDLATLDRSAEAIRAALRQNPSSIFLLEQLRRTYARRLSITQRALLG